MVPGAGALVSLGILAGISGSSRVLCRVVGIDPVSAGECQPFIQLYYINKTLSSWQNEINI
jgi:hypothetical protein